MEYSIPVIFKLEDIATKGQALPPHLSRCVHSVVAGYLLYIATAHSSTQLGDYINEVTMLIDVALKLFR